MSDDVDELADDERSLHPRIPSKPPSDPRGWKRVVLTVLALLVMLGGFATFAKMYMEVRAGRGGELYRSMDGYKVSPIGILVVAGVGVVAVCCVSAILWFQQRRDRAWGRKHGGRVE